MAALQCEICGGKLIGKPGGLFECESCGMEYNTDWAKAKVQEIKGTVKVEGTVSVRVEDAMQHLQPFLAVQLFCLDGRHAYAHASTGNRNRQEALAVGP